MRTRPGIRALQYVAVVCYLVFLGFPLLWLISSSLKSPQEFASITPSLLPKHFDLSNYSDALNEQGLVRGLGNSLQISVYSTILVLIVALPVSYALARFRSRLRPLTNGWILVSQVFPVILIVIPLFMILRPLHLTNTIPGVVIVYMVWSLPFALWMLQGYVAAVPRELEEAASVDGAGRIRTIVSIVMPLLRPGLIATAMFTFISAWNEFFFALVLLQDPQLKTLPLVLARFVGAEGQVQFGPLAAASVLATVPSLVFFAFLQRRLTSGLLSGAVKG
ncbi:MULTISPECIES: carbohydrate ABC transporter permease [Kribbella]|jgi:multiple sugar transport system permease protein|uniref:Carbohydrate ABC transporter membrane protein 2 (CUT1 family) n=1 Tax=Kribbella pratensis TaxID=2512112 RepID=A0ABY2F8G8_9ACTN|nr:MULTISPECIES: carbohydrate ABC transporter permease [Kribbella]TDO55171.1 multiple sugar transport system permease protein [Kribbella sp. VKM Ac-2571]TDW79403.1 carbohydrate ABC transporter membrane protein 2 (CUT1 family) [Kribbella sp. VKM Ac-2566]TDW84447.1 carbohydrate ABC transporter membrane protein 2 (CUT1 family) [Kribbella pratensis]